MNCCILLSLQNELSILSMDLGSTSWWASNGIGCETNEQMSVVKPHDVTTTMATVVMTTVQSTMNQTSSQALNLTLNEPLVTAMPAHTPTAARLSDNSFVSEMNSGCLISYLYVEILHAAIQCLLAVFYHCLVY